MASVSGNGVDVDSTPSAKRTSPPNTKIDTKYYLTEGLEGIEHLKYHDHTSFITAINDLRKEARLGSSRQYLVFCPITQQQFTEIDRIRDEQYKGLRFMYLNNEQALIVKIMLGSTHEIANKKFATIILRKAIQMGLEDSFGDMGSTTLTAPCGLKEGDSTFRPVDLRPYEKSWPTLVVECGVSQSLARLVADSRWWLENSGGEVKIVILISVSKTARSIHLEKWEMGIVPNQQATRANPDASRDTPTKTYEVDIADNVVTGGPLQLEFEKIMLRQPRPGEGDLIFDIQELEQFASFVWRSTQ